eukprot:13705223-Alexandrium_andersonii.AAC.1
MVDAPRAHDQVPDQPDQHCPIRGSGGRHPPAALLSCERQARAIQAKVVCPRCQRPKTLACSGVEGLCAVLGNRLASVTWE